MRKVLVLMHVSLDGFTAGPAGEMDWIRIDGDIFEDAIRLTDTVDTAMYGRVTYGLMEAYWPGVLTNPVSTENELHHANWVEQVQKIVFSRTMERVGWKNTRLIKDNIAEEVTRLRQQPGGDIMIFGSPGLVHSLMPLGLIDEYRININPVILGAGIPMFRDGDYRSKLELLQAKTFSSGVVGLYYRKV